MMCIDELKLEDLHNRLLQSAENAFFLLFLSTWPRTVGLALTYI